jgi:uncharacterized cupredoxin-like copper-binding protein
LVATAVLGLSACSGGPSVPHGARLDVTVRDFKITASSSIVPAGEVVVQVQDNGPSTHELVVIRTDLPADQLPLRPDGLLVDEDSPQLHQIDELSELGVGDRARLVLKLSPGRYVFFCNLEGHYLGGMHALLQVRSGRDEGDQNA